MSKDRNRPKRNAIRARKKRRDSKSRRVKEANKRISTAKQTIMDAWEERHKPEDITKLSG